MRKLIAALLLVPAMTVLAQSVPSQPYQPADPLTFTPLQPSHTASWHVSDWPGRGFTLQVLDHGDGELLIVAHVLTFAVDGRPIWLVAQALASGALQERDSDPHYVISAFKAYPDGRPRYAGALRLRTVAYGELDVEFWPTPQLPPGDETAEQQPSHLAARFTKLTTPVPADYVECVIAPIALPDEHAYCHAN